MAQCRFFIAVRHPLASTASSMPTHLPFGDKTARNKKNSGKLAQRKNNRWRARHYQRRPSFPWGTKSWGTQKPRGNQIKGKITTGKRVIIDAAPGSLWIRNPEEHKNLGETSSKDKHPFASAESSTPPKLPLGGKTLRKKELGRNYKEELPLGDKTLGKKEGLPLRDETMGKTTTTTPNGQWWDQTTTTTQTKTTQKQRHNKDDDQPPRVMRTKQASPLVCIFMFSPTTLNIVREQKSQSKK